MGMLKMNVTRVLESLKKKGYCVSLFERSQEAAAYLNGKIDNKTVGFGDSKTLLQLKLYESLSLHNRVFDPQQSLCEADFLKIAKSAAAADVFLTSANAFSKTGELVNIDGCGNRIAGSLFGHEKVYFVVGINKLAATLEDAIWRARNIAAPQNAMRLGLKTPCAREGQKCRDCLSSERICNGMMLYLNKMDSIEMEVVIIKETLGL